MEYMSDNHLAWSMVFADYFKDHFSYGVANIRIHFH